MWESCSVPSLIGCVLLDKPPNLSEPQAAHLRPVVRIRQDHMGEFLPGTVPGTLLCAPATVTAPVSPLP